MDWNDEILVPSGKIISIPARHFGRFLRRNRTLWSSFLADIGGCKMYIDGDSGYGEHYKAYSDEFGHIDLALLEAGQYDEDWKYIHKSPKEGEAAKDLCAKRVMAGHNSKFNLAKHPWFELLEEVYNISQTEQFLHLIPRIGEVVNINNVMQKFTTWWRTI